MISKRLILVVLFTFLLKSNYLFSQKQPDYYIIDTTMVLGIKIKDGGDKINAMFCQIKKGENIIQFGPDEVSEYFINDGRTYFSKEIVIDGVQQQAFLLRLTNGKVRLYYYKGDRVKLFFTESPVSSTSDSMIYKENQSFIYKRINKHFSDTTTYGNLTEIKHRDSQNKRILSETLNSFTAECDMADYYTSHVRYSRSSLVRFMKIYDNCDPVPFPFPKVGISFGLDFVDLNPGHYNVVGINELLNTGSETSFKVGVFFDQPLLYSDFSIHAKVGYSEHSYSHNFTDDENDYDFIANISTLDLPLMVRFVLPARKFRPFINAGGLIAFNIRNESVLYRARLSGSVIQTGEIQANQLIDKHSAGFVVGGGLELKISKRNYLYFEALFNKLFEGASYKMQQSGLGFTTGINF